MLYFNYQNGLDFNLINRRKEYRWQLPEASIELSIGPLCPLFPSTPPGPSLFLFSLALDLWWCKTRSYEILHHCTGFLLVLVPLSGVFLLWQMWIYAIAASILFSHEHPILSSRRSDSRPPFINRRLRSLLDLNFFSSTK